jgi:glycosyltransferase involved in cell wall biosynthesis
VIRKDSGKLKIGFICPTVGTFGAIREMVEVSNVLSRRGHKVFIYHPDGGEVKWLESLATCRKLGFLSHDHLDVLIGIVDWQPELYNDLLEAKAKVKAVCLLGFNPSEEMAQALRGEKSPQDKAEKIIRDAINRRFLLLADSSWQVEWIKKNVGYMEAGPPFGGINLTMFRPSKDTKKDSKLRIIYSGDPRERKGTDTVEKAIEILKTSPLVDADYDFYWGKKFDQETLVRFIQQGDIFLDGHRRAGWCNPVAEAIACGTVPVCTDIGAVGDFAIHERTALVVSVDDAEAMAAEALRLVQDENLRTKLSKNGIKHIQRFSYDLVTPVLESALEKRVHA